MKVQLENNWDVLVFSVGIPGFLILLTTTVILVSRWAGSGSSQTSQPAHIQVTAPVTLQTETQAVTVPLRIEPGEVRPVEIPVLVRAKEANLDLILKPKSESLEVPVKFKPEIGIVRVPVELESTEPVKKEKVNPDGVLLPPPKR